MFLLSTIKIWWCQYPPWSALGPCHGSEAHDSALKGMSRNLAAVSLGVVSLSLLRKEQKYCALRMGGTGDLVGTVWST